MPSKNVTKMGNPVSSILMNSEQKAECTQQLNFENEINEHIPNNKFTDPTDYEKAVNSVSNEIETMTCLQEFEEILDNVCTANVPIDTQHDIDIDIEGVNLNNLDLLGNIDEINVDNLQNWHDIYEDFVTSTESNTTQYNEEEENCNKFEIPIDNNANSNVNKDLDTWKRIYEDFSTKTNDIASVTGEDLKNTGVKCNKNVIDKLSIKHKNAYYLNNETSIVQIPKVSNSKTSETNVETEKKNPTDSFNIQKSDIQHKNAILKFIDNRKKKSSLRNIRINPFNTDIINRFKIESDTIEPNLNRKEKNNFKNEYKEKGVKMLQQANNNRADTKVSNNIHKNETLTISSDDEDPLEIVECNIHINKNPTETSKFAKQEITNTDESKKQELESYSNKYLNINKNPTNPKNELKNKELDTNNINKNANTDELKKQEVESNINYYLEISDTKELINTEDELAKKELESNNSESLNIHKQPTNTKEFEKQDVDSDCDGYNSSDFEFITEDEAKKKGPNYESLFYGPNLEVDNAKANTNNEVVDEVFSEIIDNNVAKLPLPSVESLAIHDNQKAINFNDFCDEDNIIYDYFETIEPTVTVDGFGNNTDSHRIPNEEEFQNLFSGNFIPYPMYSCFENKATTSYGITMSLDNDGLNFDMNRFRDESTPEERREAEETKQKILSMYPTENRRYRRLRRRRNL